MALCVPVRRPHAQQQRDGRLERLLHERDRRHRPDPVAVERAGADEQRLADVVRRGALADVERCGGTQRRGGYGPAWSYWRASRCPLMLHFHVPHDIMG